jgi:hypothetical protein
VPAAVQVRLACGHGLFKGMLLVSPLPQHAGNVILRESMRKLPASARWQDPRYRAETSTLDIVNTTNQSVLYTNIDLLLLLVSRRWV